MLSRAGNILWGWFSRLVRLVMSFLLRLGGIAWEEEQWDKFFQFVQFCLVGLSSAVVMYISYFITWKLCGNYFVANGIGFVFSTTNSFFWNSRFVFHVETGWKNVVFSYLKTIALYAVTGLVLSNILLYFWVDVVQISELLAPVINVIIVTPLNYILNKFWAFRKG